MSTEYMTNTLHVDLEYEEVLYIDIKIFQVGTGKWTR